MEPVFLNDDTGVPLPTKRIVMYAPNFTWARYIADSLNALYGLKPGKTRWYFSHV